MSGHRERLNETAAELGREIKAVSEALSEMHRAWARIDRLSDRAVEALLVKAHHPDARRLSTAFNDQRTRARRDISDLGAAVGTLEWLTAEMEKGG